MKRYLIPSLAVLLWATAPATAARPYVNDKKAPDNRKDLETIQNAVIDALPAARAATVCIQIGEGSGTGVIVSPDGLILSAAHVTGAVGKKLKVLMEDGTEHEAMTLGLMSENDAAMARMIGDGPWPHVEIDRDNSVRLGDWVFSLGHSGGFDKERGSVVRLGRIVRMAHSTYQSDCLLIGGDSGGPLFDLRGRLVGIHSRVGQQLAVNMHVPMTAFLNDWDRMLESEFIGEGPFARRPVKGTGYLGLATEAAEDGLKVTRVGNESPAGEAGIEVGDVIVRFNDAAPATREELQEILKEMSAGDDVTLEIRRGGEEKTIQFELGER